MSVLTVWNGAKRHPLARRAPTRALVNFLSWQVRSRLASGSIRHRWIDETCLLVKQGMTGATGNIYYGLHEFPDMGFLLHFLRADDVFADVGANIGSYTVLASGVCGARTISFEPDPGTCQHLRDNVAANDISDRVSILQKAVGSKPGLVRFSQGLDTVNHVLDAQDRSGGFSEVETVTLDAALDKTGVAFIKIDVEGYEDEVVRGFSQAVKEPKLKVIEIETESDFIRSFLAENGFEPYRYDPLKRELLAVASRGQSNNQLYLRDIDFVRNRIETARRFSALGVEF